jgi:ABC-2 type transport system ATP-binding protein
MPSRVDLRDLDGREAVITASHVQKNYRGFTAVRDATFAVARGEIFGLLGPNGAGKTTTVECLQGLREADGGEISVLGLDPVRQSRELRRRIGCQLQEAALPDHIRVWEALELFASLTPGGRDWRAVMDEWGLADKSRAAFSALSGGQRQRLFVALAVVNDPEVVFLDEMTTGLDPAARRVAWELIHEIREHGTTVVLVTHFMEEAERLCDRIAVMDKGKVVALDSPSGLVAEHAAGLRVVFRTDVDDLDFLNGVRDVESVHREGPRVVVDGRDAVLAYVAAALVAHGIAPLDLHVEAPTLEDVFLSLTGHVMAE